MCYRHRCRRRRVVVIVVSLLSSTCLVVFISLLFVRKKAETFASKSAVTARVNNGNPNKNESHKKEI